MRVIDLENINYAMRSETQFVLRCEEVFHDKISAAATTILSNKGEKPLVALTGPSGSGKTTTAMRLQEYLQNLGVHVCLLSMDNFFLPLDQRPPEPPTGSPPTASTWSSWCPASPSWPTARRRISPGTTLRRARPADIARCRATRTASSLQRASICSTR